MQPAGNDTEDIDTEDDRRVPVNVLTGFLGSGKTTLLRHILHSPAFADTAVLINEFGEVGLDHLLLGHIDAAPVLLESGCICCSIRGDLRQAMRDLLAQRRSGVIPPFRRIVVETTGLADPTPILATIAYDLVLRRDVRIGNVITTVDAVHAARGLQSYPELRKQVAVADQLVVTKADLRTAAQIDQLFTLLHRINPTAICGTADRGRVDPDVVLHDARPGSTVEANAPWLDPNAAASAQGGHANGINSFVVTHDHPLDWSAFGLWFSLLVHRYGERLLRVKGLLAIDGSATPVAIHAVQHLMHPPEHLAAWPGPSRASCIVFITNGMDAERVRRSFSTFCRLGRLG